MPPQNTSAIAYSVDAHSNARAHLYNVKMVIPTPNTQQIVRMPVWIAGSYMVRDFARNLQRLTATQNGKTLDVAQLDKCTWQIACSSKHALVLHYQIYAYDDSVRTAYLDEHRAFFNPTSLCLQVEGKTHTTHHLHLEKTTRKKVATGAKSLSTTAKKNTASYQFANYDTLADTPFEISDFWSGSFTLHGIKHRFVVTGAPDYFDGKRLLQDTKKICAQHMQFWHGKEAKNAKKLLDMDEYVFMLNATAEGYGGLEHRNSTALICRRCDLPTAQTSSKPNKISKEYTTLLGLISHEYFHTWNVKRLRPVNFTKYNYFGEQYTELLWFFEGFTSYYDDLALYRAGIIDTQRYLQLLVRAINHVQNTPGSKVQSVAQSSFDAWTKYYKRDHNTNNHTISYYVKGALVALCYDLCLRTEERGTLDDVMRVLWRHCQGGPMSEKDFLGVLKAFTGRGFLTEHQNWVHGTKPLPCLDLLQLHGVEPALRSTTLAEQLGIDMEKNTQQTTIKTVAHNSVAQKIGLSAKDELIAINGWRIQKLDDLKPHVEDGKTHSLMYARDGRILHAQLTLPTSTNKRIKSLRIEDAQAVAAWLDI